MRTNIRGAELSMYGVDNIKEFHLVNQVHVAVSHKTGEPEAVEDFSMLVKQVSIEKLHDEGRKLEPGFVGEYAHKN